MKTIQITLKNNSLVLENGKVIYLTKDMIRQFNLQKVTELSEKDFFELIKMRLTLSAVNMLSKRDYFYMELVNKLSTKIGFRELAVKVADELQKQGFLDDYECAKSFMACHLNYGLKKLSYIFSQMGLATSTINELIYENQDSEIENIKKLLRYSSRKSEEKQIASLMRKGFSYANIKKAMSLLEEEEE